jgi:crotonobetainyl-CoA:carnitine CoA-transferase CaiB-like acyl-CoA transferase
MQATLKGVRVIDFTQVAAGPTCTMMLADRGADVIKVEAPTGDLGRQLGPPWQNGQSVIFMALNRNKRSIVLDLKTSQGVETAKQLIAQSDILVESFRPGVMDRLGLGYDMARQLRPDLIYCSISAYGQHGASNDKPGVDGIVQAVSGLMSVCGFPSGEPSKVQAPVIDMTTGFLATIAVQDALLHRASTGEGQWLDVSMFASSIQLQQVSLASYLSTKEVPVPCGSGAPYSAPNEAYPTRDGWIMVAAYHPQRWQAFCSLLGLDVLIDDPRFKSSTERVMNRQQLAELISPVMRARTTQEWISALERADIICAPVANYADVTESALFSEGKFTTRFDQADAGELEVIAPFYPSEPGCTPMVQVKAPPRLGEDTQAILESLASRAAPFANTTN